MVRLSPISLGFVLCLLSIPAASHEYWIEPTKPAFEVGEKLSAHLKVGEDFKGQHQIYAPAQYEHLVIAVGERMGRITGTLGDLPAVNMRQVPEGLAVLALITTYANITYTEFEKFEKFATVHGEAEAVDRHLERGLPTDRIREAYRRFAKALVKVGDGEGPDVQFDMEFELTALENPHGGNGEVPYLLTRAGTPVPGHQVDIFYRAAEGEDAQKTIVATDEEGKVQVPTRPGITMVSAVALEEPSAELAEAEDVVWYSLWATSTFWLQ